MVATAISWDKYSANSLLIPEVTENKILTE